MKNQIFPGSAKLFSFSPAGTRYHRLQFRAKENSAASYNIQIMCKILAIVWLDSSVFQQKTWPVGQAALVRYLALR
jgi:hypothetical protein